MKRSHPVLSNDAEPSKRLKRSRSRSIVPSPSPERHARTALLREGYVQGLPLFYTSVGRYRDKFIGLFDVCEDGFSLPCRGVENKSCTASEKTVYISKDRNFYLVGVYDKSAQTYHKSFKNICWLLEQRDKVLLVFIALLNKNEPTTQQQIQRIQNNVQEIMKESSQDSFHSWTDFLALYSKKGSAVVSRAFSAFTIASVYTEGSTWLKNKLAAIEKESFASFFLPAYVPHLQTVLSIVELFTSWASDLSSMWIKYRKNIHENRTCRVFYWVSLVLLLIVPFVTLWLLKDTAWSEDLNKFFVDHIVLLPGLQFLHLVFKTFPAADTRNFKSYIEWFVKSVMGAFKRIVSFDAPEVYGSFLIKTLYDCKKKLESFDIKEFFHCFLKRLVEFIEAQEVMHLVNTVRQPTMLLEFLKAGKYKSHFDENGKINLQALMDKMSLLNVWYSILRSFNNAFTSFVRAVVEWLCPSVALLSPSSAGYRDHSPMRELFNVQSAIENV